MTTQRHRSSGWIKKKIRDAVARRNDEDGDALDIVVIAKGGREIGLVEKGG